MTTAVLKQEPREQRANEAEAVGTTVVSEAAQAAVANAANLVAAPAVQPVISPKPVAGELSAETQEWIASAARTSDMTAGQVCLALLAMCAFLAVTAVGIWLNATSTFPAI
jgi:hypothetical protein